MKAFTVATASTLAPASALEVAIGHVERADVAADAEPHRRRILTFCAEQPDALHRSCETGHLTGSAAVIQRGSGAVALLLHAKVGRWFQPGGHADGEANLGLVGLTEAAEETGLTDLELVVPALDLDVHVFDAPGEMRHLHLDVRSLVLAPRGAALVANHESRDLRWVDPDDLGAYDPDPGLVRLARRARDVAAELGAV